jgi:hypothetical protein
MRPHYCLKTEMDATLNPAGEENDQRSLTADDEPLLILPEPNVI